MKHKLIPVILFTFSCTAISAQNNRRDKAEYIPYQNGFFEQIQKENGTTYPASAPKKVFKMDFSSMDLPKSANEFKTAWSDKPESQGLTNTCWSFSTTSFYESEIFRLSGQKINLSQMYIVYWEFVEKAREFVRTRGTSEFGEGSETNAPKRMMKMYGIVPYESYPGNTKDKVFYDHVKMFAEMQAYMQNVKTNNAWNEEAVISTIKSMMHHYIGEVPKSVTLNGKTMSPQEYLKNVTKLNPDDYIDFMSLMEQPYWKQTLYNAPDNWWRSTDYYNVPLDDFMGVIKGAVKAGYSIAIGGDVSESGMDSYKEVAVVPTYDIPSEYIDQYARQMRFSNKSTTDDHAIHLVGYLEKPNGMWFLIKDSGSGAFNGENKGYYFFHEDYVKLKMMTITLHKDAAKEILTKFNKQ